MKDLGNLNTFLGIKISRENGKMFFSQQVYLEKLLNRFSMNECKSSTTPMETKFISESSNDLFDKPYRELIGCLMYLTQTTRPDLSFSVNFFSRFQSNPKEEHWSGLKRILRYIQGTKDFGLLFVKGNVEEPLIAFADADWGNSEDRKSTSGYLFNLFGNTVCWQTKRQHTVAQSSTEAEFVSLAMCASEFLWLKNLLSEFKIVNADTVTIFEDNQSCIHSLKRWEHKRMKHIDIKYNFLRDLVDRDILRVKYVRTDEQIADILTKSLNASKFVYLRKKTRRCAELYGCLK